MAGANTIALAKRAASGGGTAWATTETIVPLYSDSTTPAIVYLPSDKVADGQRFKLFVAYRMTGGTTTNVTVALYKGSSLTLGSNTKVATGAAVACNSASSNGELEVEGTYDAVSKIINWRMQGRTNATAEALAAATAAVSSVTSGTAVPFCVSGKFSASDAGNVFQVLKLGIALVD